MMSSESNTKQQQPSTMRNLMSCATLQPKNVSKSNKWQKESAFFSTHQPKKKDNNDSQPVTGLELTHTHTTHKIAYEK